MSIGTNFKKSVQRRTCQPARSPSTLATFPGSTCPRRRCPQWLHRSRRPRSRAADVPRLVLPPRRVPHFICVPILFPVVVTAMAAVAEKDAKVATLAAAADAPAVAAPAADGAAPADSAAPADGAASASADAEAAKVARQLEKKLKKEAQKKEQKEKKEKKAAAAAAASAKKKGESKEGMDVGKEEDFPRWYNQVITKSELIEFYDISVRRDGRGRRGGSARRAAGCWETGGWLHSGARAATAWCRRIAWVLRSALWRRGRGTAWNTVAAGVPVCLRRLTPLLDPLRVCTALSPCAIALGACSFVVTGRLLRMD